MGDQSDDIRPYRIEVAQTALDVALTLVECSASR